MGSSFFKPANGFVRGALDPIGTIVGQIAQKAGPNSWFAKMNAYDPIVSSGVGKVLNPQAHQLGQEYANRHNPADGNWGTPGAYAGQDPTLRAANAGYVNAANGAVNQANKVWQTGQQPNQQNQQNPYGS